MQLESRRVYTGRVVRLDVDNVILWPTPRSRSLYTRHGFMVADNMLVLRRAGES